MFVLSSEIINGDLSIVINVVLFAVSPVCDNFTLLSKILQVTITPEVSSRNMNRAIMAELVKLYKESDLGMRLPAYDGRKSLYTAGELPFAWKEFNIKLTDEDDGVNGPKYDFIVCFSLMYFSFDFFANFYSFM